MSNEGGGSGGKPPPEKDDKDKDKKPGDKNVPFMFFQPKAPQPSAPLEGTAAPKKIDKDETKPPAEADASTLASARSGYSKERNREELYRLINDRKRRLEQQKLKAAKEAGAAALANYENQTAETKAEQEARKQRQAEEEAKKKAEAEITAAEKKKKADLAEVKKQFEGKDRYEYAGPDLLANLQKKTIAGDAGRRKTLAASGVLNQATQKFGSNKVSFGPTSTGPKGSKTKVEKETKKEEDGENQEDSGSTHEMHKYSKFDPALVFGPVASVNYQWFSKRLSKANLRMCWISTVISFALAIMFYVFFVLPRQLVTTDILKDILGSKETYFVLSGWVFCAVAFLSLLYAVALIQYFHPYYWPRIGKGRWFPLPLVELFLIVCTLNYAIQLYRIPMEVRGGMKKDMKLNQGKRLQDIQRYFECCGIDSYKDWFPHSESSTTNRTWHGNLCDPNATEMYNFGKRLCNIPVSCWHKDSRIKRSIHPNPCFNTAVTLSFSIIGVFILTCMIVILSTSATFWYMRKVITMANTKGVELKPKLQFEECL